MAAPRRASSVASTPAPDAPDLRGKGPPPHHGMQEYRTAGNCAGARRLRFTLRSDPPSISVARLVALAAAAARTCPRGPCRETGAIPAQAIGPKPRHPVPGSPRTPLNAAWQDVSAETACEISHKASPRKRRDPPGRRHERASQGDQAAVGLSLQALSVLRSPGIHEQVCRRLLVEPV